MLFVPKVRLNMQAVEPARQLAQVAEVLVEVGGANGLAPRLVPPSPAFQRKTCRMAPEVALSIKAIFVPSGEMVGEPSIGEAAPAVLVL